MNWKNRFTNYNFWISIVSAILLICQAFKLEFDIAYVNEIATAVLGLLVVIGIISDPTKVAIKKVEGESKDNSSKEAEANCVNQTEKQDASEILTDNETSEIEKEENINIEETEIPIEKQNEIADVDNKDNIQVFIDDLYNATEAKEVDNINKDNSILENKFVDALRDLFESIKNKDCLNVDLQESQKQEKDINNNENDTVEETQASIVNQEETTPDESNGYIFNIVN